MGEQLHSSLTRSIRGVPVSHALPYFIFFIMVSKLLSNYMLCADSNRITGSLLHTIKWPVGRTRYDHLATKTFLNLQFCPVPNIRHQNRLLVEDLVVSSFLPHPECICQGHL